MKRLSLALAAGLLCLSSAYAEPISDATVAELRAVMDSDRLLKDASKRISASLDPLIAQHLKGKPPTEAQKRAIAQTQEKLQVWIQNLRTFIEPLTVQALKELYSEEEAQALIRFYKSPAGKAFVEKLPVISKEFQDEIQKEKERNLEKLKRDLIQAIQTADRTTTRSDKE